MNSKFNIDRDIGIQLRHKLRLGGNWIIKEKFSISQGEGRNITEGNIGGLQYTSRLELLPFGADNSFNLFLIKSTFITFLIYC